MQILQNSGPTTLSYGTTDLGALQAPHAAETKTGHATILPIPGLDAQGGIHSDLRNLGQSVSRVVSMTTQLPTNVFFSFKYLKLKLAIVTPFSIGVVTSPAKHKMC